jgi:hypothetical protein
MACLQMERAGRWRCSQGRVASVSDDSISGIHPGHLCTLSLSELDIELEGIPLHYPHAAMPRGLLSAGICCCCYTCFGDGLFANGASGGGGDAVGAVWQALETTPSVASIQAVCAHLCYRSRSFAWGAWCSAKPCRLLLVVESLVAPPAFLPLVGTSWEGRERGVTPGPEWTIRKRLSGLCSPAVVRPLSLCTHTRAGFPVIVEYISHPLTWIRIQRSCLPQSLCVWLYVL